MHSDRLYVVILCKLCVYLALFTQWLAAVYMVLSLLEGYGATAFVAPSHLENEGFWANYQCVKHTSSALTHSLTHTLCTHSPTHSVALYCRYALFWSMRVLTDVGGEQEQPETDWER